ncbi:MAG: hypothetical protein ABH844_06770 [Candidatus Omnitrophota bacterium]
MKNTKGFSLIEVIFAGVISAMVVVAIMSVYLFSSKIWTGENKRTNLRVDLVKALETIKNDLRLSSLSSIVFYPASGEPYAAMSLPIAKTDANGFFTLNSKGKIEWDKTIIYHIYTDGEGNKTLRRTVFDPRDNTIDKANRYFQLEGVVNAGEVSGSAVTDTGFLKNLDIFEISSLSQVIEFYEDSAVPVRKGKIVFGWAKLTLGAHIIRFEITGKNDLSSGFNIGVDNIMLEPSSSAREAEYYKSSFAPSGALVETGGGTSLVQDTMWSNNNYLEFSAGGTGSNIEITDYYDLWRESAFNLSALNNTEKIGQETRIALNLPEEGESGDFTWFAYEEAEDEEQGGRDGNLPGDLVLPAVLRCVITYDKIYKGGDLIRVGFKSSTDNPLTITSAYITKRNGTSGANGLANQGPSGLEVEDYHRHQQLFFKNQTTGVIEKGVTIPADSEAWSVWTAFPLREDSDYLISFSIPVGGVVDCKYWEGSVGTDRVYYVNGANNTTAGKPDWSGETYTATADSNIYITSNIDVWDAQGSVESQIFDTTLSAPGYNQIKWSESRPDGTDISLKVRSSDDEYMSGATKWEDITGSGVNPRAAGVASDRYVQFLSELISEPFWQAGASTLAYPDYILDQISHPAEPYLFPENGIEPYISELAAVWIDDVEIDWPGSERLCTITGYIAKKNNYGQAKITVDGEDLVKMLRIHVKVSRETLTRAIEEENYIEITPRNTGK